MKTAVFFIFAIAISLILVCAYERDRRSLLLQITNLNSKVAALSGDYPSLFPVRHIPHEPHLAAVLVTTNLVHRPCPCGFCRPEEGVAVLEHINRIGYDLKLEVNTNYLPVVELPIPANSSVISPFMPRRYVLNPAAVAANHLAALTNCLTLTIVTNLPPPAELPALADIVAKDTQEWTIEAWTNAPPQTTTYDTTSSFKSTAN